MLENIGNLSNLRSLSLLLDEIPDLDIKVLGKNLEKLK